MKRIFIIPIKIYQHTIGPILPPACRYYPSCSNYFIEAIEKKGIMAGAVLGIWRLLRCQPFGGSGYDPVR
ncbi:MAG: membrane protein insertion efficiency factor YidD [Planctomycetes bacterium RBG_16_43_13]|nr:MAG: membrane protein insertion efficiency factor YidD [Planctomycetes bacterium RBG_16_43_13]